MLTNAGGNRVHVGVLGPDSHLGAGTGLAADGLYLHSAVKDLGHFQLKQALDKAGMGAADHHAGAALGADHVHDVDLQGLALGVHLAGHLLVAGQNSLAALAQIQRNDALLGIHAGNGGLHDVMCAGLDLAELLVALGLADALTDDVLCGLGGNTAKIAGLERGDDAVAHLVAAADLACLGHTDLGVLVVPVLVCHDILDQRHIKAAGVGVDVHTDVILLDLIVLLDGNDDSRLDLFDQVFCGDAALMLQHGERFKKVLIRCCHFSGSSYIFCSLFSIRDGSSQLNRSSSSHSCTPEAAFTSKVTGPFSLSSVTVLPSRPVRMPDSSRTPSALGRMSFARTFWPFSAS